MYACIYVYTLLQQQYITSVKKMLPTMSKDSEIKEGENKNLIKIVERPTFILKTREGENRAVSPSQRNGHKYSIIK